MSRLQDWIVHRSAIIKLAWPQGVAEAAGVAPAALDSIAVTGNLRQIGRGTRGYLARALKVSVRELEALAAGRIDWIADERRIEFDRLTAITSRASGSPAPEAVLCAPGRGIPILGRILETGLAEHFDDWTSEDGPRLAVRYSGLPDAFSLELTIAFGPYLAGECLVFQGVAPGELGDGELALLAFSVWERESELCIVRKGPDPMHYAVISIDSARPEREIPLVDIVRAARVLGAWKR